MLEPGPDSVSYSSIVSRRSGGARTCLVGVLLVGMLTPKQLVAEQQEEIDPSRELHFRTGKDGWLIESPLHPKELSGDTPSLDQVLAVLHENERLYDPIEVRTHWKRTRLPRDRGSKPLSYEEHRHSIRCNGMGWLEVDLPQGRFPVFGDREIHQRPTCRYDGEWISQLFETDREETGKLKAEHAYGFHVSRSVGEQPHSVFWDVSANWFGTRLSRYLSNV